MSYIPISTVKVLNSAQSYYIYLKTLNNTFTNYNSPDYLQLAGSSTPYTIPSQVFSSNISTTAPDIITDPSNNPIDVSGTEIGRRYTTHDPNIFYYQIQLNYNVSLSAYTTYNGDPNNYVIIDASGLSTSYSTHVIPNNYGDGTYTINVYKGEPNLDNKNDNLIDQKNYPYIFDPASGWLSFTLNQYDTNNGNTSANPWISYFRYEGAFGGGGGGDSYFTANGTTVSLISSYNTIQANSFNSASDYRIKENIRKLDTTDFNIDQLNPVTYINKLSNKQDIGFIAHELQKEFPFLVEGEKDGEENQSIHYTGLIGVLVKEIQDLKKRVLYLENKN